MTTATKKRRARPRRKPRVRPPRSVDTPLTERPDNDKLPNHVKLDVVQRLAMYDGPQEVSEAVKKDYGIEISRQAVQHYDPTVGAKPAEKWCEIFAATRKKFLEDVAEAAPIALRSVRLRRLDRVCVRAEKSGNGMMVLASTEQAAKEVGELYTNRHKMELTGKDGGPVEVKTDDLRKRIVGRIAGVAARIAPPGNNTGAVAGRIAGARV